MNPYLDVDFEKEFEEEFVIVPSHAPHDSWVLVDEMEVKELEEDHLQRQRMKAVQKRFHTELIKISTITGKSVAELSATWADRLVDQVKRSGKKVSEVSHMFKERLCALIDKKAEPEFLIDPYGVREGLEPCFPPARVV